MIEWLSLSLPSAQEEEEDEVEIHIITIINIRASPEYVTLSRAGIRSLDDD